jgi:polyisoprenoid-binding protein YceI
VNARFGALHRISTMRGRSWLVGALGILLASCAPEVQRAALVPAYPEVSAPNAATANAQTKKLVFRSPHARVHVYSNDALNGDHHLHFAPVRGTYRVDPASGRARLHIEIGMRGIRAEEYWIASFAGRMLAVDEFPKTVMNANVEPVENEPEKRDVKGNITLRGIERGIHFRATVRDEPEGIRFRAVFDMSRSAFGIRAKPEEGDSLIRDDFTVTLEFHATPEHVRVETFDEKKERPPSNPDAYDPADDPLFDDVVTP